MKRNGIEDKPEIRRFRRLPPGSRLTFGSYQETVLVPGISGSAIIAAMSLYSNSGFGESAFVFLLNAAVFFMLATASFPLYCWAMRHRRITPLTIIEPEIQQKK